MYITHEGKPTSKSNLRLLSLNGNIEVNQEEMGYVDIEVLVSYATPVAYSIGGLWHYTSQKYSPTTSKQITRFLNARIGGRANALEVNQEEVDHMYKTNFLEDTSLSREFMYG